MHLETEIEGWTAAWQIPKPPVSTSTDPAHFEIYSNLNASWKLKMHDWEKLHYELELLTGQI